MAKKFKLQTVLNYRQTLEDQAQQQLNSSLQRKLQLEEALAQQQQCLQELDQQLKAQQQEGLSVADLTLFESQIQHRQRQSAQLREQLELLERQVLADRQELIRVARDRQVMEKLKDKQDAEYLKELSRKEREMLDEISLRSKGDIL